MTLDQYQQLYDTMIITSAKRVEVKSLVARIATGRMKYEVPANRIGCPWYFVGIIHCMECGLNFNTHLHNGDPLTAKTVHVPAGRPLQGMPPYDWASSAIDALLLRKLDQVTDWSITGMLDQLERYNGLGYQKRAIYSPYLWSYSNHYTKGKFVADGKFNPDAVSKQCGAAILLKTILQ